MIFARPLQSYRTMSINIRHKVLQKAPAAMAVAAIGVLVFNITMNKQIMKEELESKTQEPFSADSRGSQANVNIELSCNRSNS